MPTRIGGAVGVAGVTYAPTVGKSGVLHVKWEAGSTPDSTFNDGFDNWTLQASVKHGTGNEPGSAFYTCLSFTNATSRTVTPTFTGATPTFKHTELEEWSSATGAFALDGAVQSATGTGSGSSGTYTTPTATATAAGVAFYGVSDFASLGTMTGGGTPAFAISANGGAANGDSFLAVATVTGAGSVSPNMSTTTGNTRFVNLLMLLKEVSPDGSTSVAHLD